MKRRPEADDKLARFDAVYSLHEQRKWMMLLSFRERSIGNATKKRKQLLPFQFVFKTVD